MRSKLSSISRNAGISLCALGGYILFGWIIGNEPMVRVAPGSPAMAINTAAMFLICGICLLCAHSTKEIPRRLFRALPFVLILAPCAILVQHIFGIDLGIDWASVHAALGDGHAKPGRTAPNACLGFLFAGIVFILTRSRVPGRITHRITSVLASIVLVIGITAFLGYLFNLEALYQIASYNKMATLTALGMTALGAGIWSLQAQFSPVARAAAQPDVGHVSLLAATLLIVFAVATGLAAFGILKNSYERSATNSLWHTAKTSALSISSLLDKTTLLSKSVATRSILESSLLSLEKDAQDAGAISLLRQEVRNLSGLGFSGIHILNAKNEVLVSEGSFVADKSLMSVPLGANKENGVLLWDEDYVYRSEYDIARADKLLGKIIIERRLTSFNEFIGQARELAQSSDVLLCTRVNQDASCFPSRFYKTNIRFPLYKPDGTPTLPAARAVLGETGAEVTKDLRGTLVMAAYVPIPEYGLGIVEKVDASEFYSPLREKMPLLFAAVLVFVLIGTFLLRKWVNPVVARIASERQRMKAILNNANDAFIAVDSSGEIIDWNVEAERLLGWDASQATGKELSKLLSSAYEGKGENSDIQRMMSMVSAPRPNQRIEVSVPGKTGMTIPFEVSVAHFMIEHQPAAGLFLRDLREQKDAEKRLEEARATLAHAQKLDAVGKLTGGIAHDFNNVLQVITGSLQLMEIENQDSFKIQKRLAAATSAVERGAKLSSQLLAFARKQPLKPVVTNLGRVVRDLNEILLRAIGERVQVETVVAGGLWNTLVDPNQLEHVILNLAINARDAMQGEGQLTIEVGNASLEDDYVKSEPGLKAGQYVMLAISDTGCGMTPEIIERAFEPFFTTKSEGAGTGLGLSMAYGFIKQSNGHIKIYSEVGHGTTVKLYLPRSFEKESPYTPSSSDKIEGGDESILVVEDDLTVQATAVELLSDLGYTVHKADNAEAALGIIKSGTHIDLLFTDVVMPGALRSPDLAKLAKSILPELKVLYTSGYTQNAIVHGGRLDPGVHLLSKPYRRDQLARKLRELLSSELEHSSLESAES